MDCRVVLEAAVPVYDVAGPDEAVRIAISKTGEMLNPDLNYVEIEMGERACPDCGAALPSAFVAADEALVALELSMDVFNVEQEEHATRIARSEIGGRMENVPLEVLEVRRAPEGDETEGEAPADDEESGAGRETGGDRADAAGETAGDDGGTDDEVLPEFDDLLEDG